MYIYTPRKNDIGFMLVCIIYRFKGFLFLCFHNNYSGQNRNSKEIVCLVSLKTLRTKFIYGIKPQSL